MDNIDSDPFAKLALKDDEKLPATDLVEGYDVITNEKKYNNLTSVFDIFGNKYYRCPLQGVNENIKLYDKDRKEIKYDIRQVVITPYDIIIKTCFNENNRGELRNKLNTLFAVVCPRYEHFINYSANNNLFISCDNKVEVFSLESSEINMRHVTATKKGDVLRKQLVPNN